MKKLPILVFVMLLFALGIAGCGGSPEAQIEDPIESETEQEDPVPNEDQESDLDMETYLIGKSEEFNGLTVMLEAVSLAKEALGEESSKADAVIIHFKIHNSREDGEFSLYPDQGTLITSTGEQIKASSLLSDSLGGDIFEGVTKEGVVFWVLEKGGVYDIEWLRVRFNAYDETKSTGSGRLKEFDLKFDILK